MGFNRVYWWIFLFVVGGRVGAPEGGVATRLIQRMFLVSILHTLASNLWMHARQRPPKSGCLQGCSLTSELHKTTTPHVRCVLADANNQKVGIS